MWSLDCAHEERWLLLASLLMNKWAVSVCYCLLVCVEAFALYVDVVEVNVVFDGRDLEADEINFVHFR